jgi:hypothetical protein
MGIMSNKGGMSCWIVRGSEHRQGPRQRARYRQWELNLEAVLVGLALNGVSCQGERRTDESEERGLSLRLLPYCRILALFFWQMKLMVYSNSFASANLVAKCATGVYGLANLAK